MARKKEISDGYMAYLSTEETSPLFTQNWSSRERVKDSFMSVSFYTYLCIYVCLYLQLSLDDQLIESVALERIVRGTLAELSKNLLISLSLRNKIILSKQKL